MNCLRATVRFEVERNASANRDATQRTSHVTGLCVPGLPMGPIFNTKRVQAQVWTDQSKLIVLYVGTLDLIAKSAAGPPLASIVCSALIT